jgi:membrane-associated protease RseP (regulator of RpoE activity)
VCAEAERLAVIGPAGAQVEPVRQQTENAEVPDLQTGPASSRSGSALPQGHEQPERAHQGWAFVRLALVIAGIVALAMAAGQQALLIVIVAIIAMVMVHELGHFATAKWSKMLVTQYFVGFGPTLWSVRRGETEYGIKAIPAGGFVKIPGMTSVDEVPPEDEARTYRQQPFHRRIIVASAGSFMHLLMALLLAWIAVVAFGVASPTGVEVGGFVKWAGDAQNAAQAAGLQAGDQITSIDGRRITSATQFTAAVQRSAGSPLTFGVLRAGHPVTLHVTPVAGRALSNGTEVVSGATGSAAKGIIGVTLQPIRTSVGPIHAVGSAASNVWNVTTATVAGLAHVFSPHGIGSLYTDVTNSHAAQQASTNGSRPESIYGGVRLADQAEHAGILALIEVLIALNIVLGIMNMLPMLPLDGGHVAIALYERVRTRRGQPFYRADAAKLMPVATAFMTLLLLFVAAAVYLDIAHPIANPFH